MDEETQDAPAKKDRILIYVPAGSTLKQDLEHRAVDAHMSLTEYVRRILEMHIEGKDS